MWRCGINSFQLVPLKCRFIQRRVSHHMQSARTNQHRSRDMRTIRLTELWSFHCPGSSCAVALDKPVSPSSFLFCIVRTVLRFVFAYIGVFFHSFFIYFIRNFHENEWKWFRAPLAVWQPRMNAPYHIIRKTNFTLWISGQHFLSVYYKKIFHLLFPVFLCFLLPAFSPLLIYRYAPTNPWVFN